MTKKYYELESIFVGRFFRAEKQLPKIIFSQNEIEILQKRPIDNKKMKYLNYQQKNT